MRHRLIVEDPARPLPPTAEVSGTATITTDLPERVVVETDTQAAAYLVLADTFDPGWSATVDGNPAVIRPAYVAFRAVALPPGSHTVVFTYCPAGFRLGLGISVCGAIPAILLLIRPGRRSAGSGEHAPVFSAVRFRKVLFLSIAAILLLSAFQVGPGARISLHNRWEGSFHRFTWGAGWAAMKQNRQ
jgi:hypothetical protein